MGQNNTQGEPALSIRRLIRGIFLKYFYLRRDMESEDVITENIRAQVDFKGANLWILIFAVLMASLGLNVNSTAVIIGAMLISPLMGPIIGIGLAVGINDFILLKRSANSFFIAVFISILTAVVYFFFTPLSDVQSELLARTSPTIYDVFIALFGGLAGIIAVCSKSKGLVLPGVAIATALMPPLCTVGFGIATGHFVYAIGALYLFFINSVFIALATFLGIRFMKFKKKVFIDPQRERRVRQYIIAIAILTMVPSLYMTYHIVQRTIFEGELKEFMLKEMNWPGTHIMSHEGNYDAQSARIVLVGEQVQDSVLHSLHALLPKYGLKGVNINIIQGSANDSSMYKAFVNTAQNRTLLVQDQSLQLDQMRAHLNEMSRFQRLSATIMPEMKLIYPSVTSLSLSQVVTAFAHEGKAADTLTVALVTMDEPLTTTDRARMRGWLKIRSASDTLRIIVNQ